MIKIEPNREYHASAPLSKSRLWEMRRSPQWFKYKEEHRDETKTDALLTGSAFHKLVLEPDGFCDEFAVLPENTDRRTKDGKAAYQAFLDANAGKDILTPDMYFLASEMAQAVSENRKAAFLTKGDVEQSYYFTDELTGIECKVRPDCFKVIEGHGFIIDLKSCRSAEPDEFMRDAIKLGYDLQAAMYKTGVEKERGIKCDFVFVAVEKDPPHLINIMQCDDLLITRGMDLFREYLGLYKHCSETGNWFGLNGEYDILNNLSLPKWLAKEIE